MVDFRHWPANWRIKCFWFFHLFLFYSNVRQSHYISRANSSWDPLPSVTRVETDAAFSSITWTWTCLFSYSLCHPPLLHTNKLAVNTSPVIHVTWNLSKKYSLESAYILWLIYCTKINCLQATRRGWNLHRGNILHQKISSWSTLFTKACHSQCPSQSSSKWWSSWYK